MSARIINLPENPRILVARTDRVGDVVLSLPVFVSIRKACPGAHICALVRDYTRELLENREDVDEIISFDSQTSHVPLRRLPSLAREIRNRRFDAALVLHLNFSVALALALARIPARIGPASKAAQVMLTHRIAQSRSRGSRHEADHNLDLLKPLAVPPVRIASIHTTRSPEFFTRSSGKPLVGVHPGCGGSSRNWPERYYAQLLGLLATAGVEVAVSGAPHEKELVDRIIKTSGVSAQVYIGNGGLKQLACALAQLDVLVAPSTGPLHMAGAVGTPVVGIYCPIFTSLPRRWGPIGADDTAIVPAVDPCGKCVEDRCEHFDCMESISPARVAEAVLSKLSYPKPCGLELPAARGIRP